MPRRCSIHDPTTPSLSQSLSFRKKENRSSSSLQQYSREPKDKKGKVFRLLVCIGCGSEKEERRKIATTSKTMAAVDIMHASDGGNDEEYDDTQLKSLIDENGNVQNVSDDSMNTNSNGGGGRRRFGWRVRRVVQNRRRNQQRGKNADGPKEKDSLLSDNDGEYDDDNDYEEEQRRYTAPLNRNRNMNSDDEEEEEDEDDDDDDSEEEEDEGVDLLLPNDEIQHYNHNADNDDDDEEDDDEEDEDGDESNDTEDDDEDERQQHYQQQHSFNYDQDGDEYYINPNGRKQLNGRIEGFGSKEPPPRKRSSNNSAAALVSPRSFRERVRSFTDNRRRKMAIGYDDGDTLSVSWSERIENRIVELIDELIPPISASTIPDDEDDNGGYTAIGSGGHQPPYIPDEYRVLHSRAFGAQAGNNVIPPQFRIQNQSGGGSRQTNQHYQHSHFSRRRSEILHNICEIKQQLRSAASDTERQAYARSLQLEINELRKVNGFENAIANQQSHACGGGGGRGGTSRWGRTKSSADYRRRQFKKDEDYIHFLEKELQTMELAVATWKKRSKQLEREVAKLKGIEFFDNDSSSDDDDSSPGNSQKEEEGQQGKSEIEWHSTNATDDLQEGVLIDVVDDTSNITQANIVKASASNDCGKRDDEEDGIEWQTEPVHEGVLVEIEEVAKGSVGDENETSKPLNDLDQTNGGDVNLFDLSSPDENEANLLELRAQDVPATIISTADVKLDSKMDNTPSTAKHHEPSTPAPSSKAAPPQSRTQPPAMPSDPPPTPPSSPPPSPPPTDEGTAEKLEKNDQIEEHEINDDKTESSSKSEVKNEDNMGHVVEGHPGLSSKLEQSKEVDTNEAGNTNVDSSPSLDEHGGVVMEEADEDEVASAPSLDAIDDTGIKNSGYDKMDKVDDETKEGTQGCADEQKNDDDVTKIMSASPEETELSTQPASPPSNPPPSDLPFDDEGKQNVGEEGKIEETDTHMSENDAEGDWI